MAYKLFLSYTREKNEFNDVSNFRKRLENQLKVKVGDEELTIFLDTDLLTGTKWDDRLLSELDSSDCLIVLLSPLWLNSDYCRKEYTHFCGKLDNKRPIIPVLWEETNDTKELNDEKRAILLELRELQKKDWSDIKYEEWGSSLSQKALSDLAKDIKKLL